MANWVLGRHMLDRPIFVIGCGRSGTTLLGEAVGAHPHVCYLNEPRDIWHAAMPQADVWSDRSAVRGGRIALGWDDWTQETNDKLHLLFEKAVAEQGAARLCEKLPINAFRLPLLARMFPDAYIIYIERDGVQVANSIAKRIDASSWFGFEDRKWHLLVEFAEANASTQGIARRCKTSFQKGLLEWMLSCTTARLFIEQHRQRSIVVRCDDLWNAPGEVGNRIEVGCALPLSGAPGRFLKDNVRPYRPSERVHLDEVASTMLAYWSRVAASTPAISSRIGAPASS
jgi:Sulfotransferase family